MTYAACDNVSASEENRPVTRIRMRDPARAKHRKEMGKRLAVARGQREPATVAKHLRVPVNTYLGWERGRTSMPLHLIGPFCELTGYPPGFVVTGVPIGDWDALGTETGKFRKLS